MGMARSQGDVVITLPVLDRLIDLEPKNSLEVPLSRVQSARVLKNALRRDLEWLLNTRRIPEVPDESLKELHSSLYLYGLPDFSTHTLASTADQAKLLRQITATIKLFEPRLANVRVIPLPTEETGLKDLKVRIEGMLLMDPVPEPVSFDTVIETKSGNCRLTGAKDAG
jgi:type VI secretion system protein ImpF